MGKSRRLLQLRSRLGRLLCLALTASGAAMEMGCSDDDNSGTAVTAQTINQWCSSLCDWSRACGESKSSSCVWSCQMQDGFVAFGGRAEFFVAMTQCLESDSRCTGGTEASWAACAERASLETVLTQSAYDFCAEMGQRFFECGYSMAPDTCARNFIYLNDAKLSLAAACSKSSCDELEDCISTVATGQGA